MYTHTHTHTYVYIYKYIYIYIYTGLGKLFFESNLVKSKSILIKCN